MIYLDSSRCSHAFTLYAHCFKFVHCDALFHVSPGNPRARSIDRCVRCHIISSCGLDTVEICRVNWEWSGHAHSIRFRSDLPTEVVAACRDM